MIRLPVGVEGDLHVDLPGGGRAQLAARGAEVRLHASRWRELRVLRAALHRARPSFDARRALHVADLGAAVCVRGRCVLSLRRDPRKAPRWRIHPLAVLRSLYGGSAPTP